MGNTISYRGFYRGGKERKMKIIENYDPDGVAFETLEYGDVFVYQGSYYIKCNNTETLYGLHRK